MNIKILTPKQSLNKAFSKLSPTQKEIDEFKANLKKELLDRIDNTKTEEFHKNLVVAFLKKTYYEPDHYINVDHHIDLAINNGPNPNSPVGVIIEAKRPTNTNEMITTANINAKALHELVLYYLRERITRHNLEIKYLIATNMYEWFIFDAHLFERLFAGNKALVKQFNEFEQGRMGGSKTDFFYNQIAKPFIGNITGEIEFTYFDLSKYDVNNDIKLIPLFKVLSPQHLLKLPFANDSNSLNKGFYNELLHIMGLIEIKRNGKKLIERQKDDQRHTGSLIENTIIQLDSRDIPGHVSNPERFGKDTDERLFNITLELVITWLNRILFLKLLETQLVAYHSNDQAFKLLTTDRLRDYDDLDSLFFQVLARTPEKRNPDVKAAFANVPYLNSSLFEPTPLEHETIFISNLADNKAIPILPATVLKDRAGKRRTGALNTLQYLFEFLDAYNFSSEGALEIRTEDKTLINAAVLGLIFEKINGYKDGSFFTPGFITMYMSREAIQKAVIQKFNDAKGWNCTDITSLYNKIEDHDDANRIINQLKICDPAVGSGHFLVSALNELIAIKSKLELLYDKTGKRLKHYQATVENDDLIVTDEHGEFFIYNPKDPESRRVQETLFHEKQTIIENCLFGVDINPNSVKICRLRLWIELLKNAYYKDDGQLETLPNIDINIKQGNSLISRFPLNADLSLALQKSKWGIRNYRDFIVVYRNAPTKELKHEMRDLINEIKQNFWTEIIKSNSKEVRLHKVRQEISDNEALLIKRSEKEEAIWQKKLKKLRAEEQKLDAEVKDLKSNKIYNDAFEWRYEFPEVLDDRGNFTGFDVVIGNPPYVQIQKSDTDYSLVRSRYSTYAQTGDIYCLFYEKGYRILRNNGILTFITSNKWMRAAYGKSLRGFFLRNTVIQELIDLGDSPIFPEATTYTNIIRFEKSNKTNGIDVYDISSSRNPPDSLGCMLKVLGPSTPMFSEDRFIILDPDMAVVKQRIEQAGTPLGDWDVAINYGIKTGFNEAFIIDRQKKDELIAADPKSAQVIKPILRGRDIKRYKAEFADKWLIATLPALNLDIDDYPAIRDYLKSFGRRLYQTGEEFGRDKNGRPIKSRKKTGNKWFETQDQIAYYKEFEKEKSVWAEIVFDSAFYYDTSGLYPEATTFILTGRDTKFLTAMLNSQLLTFGFKAFYAGGDLRGNTFRYKKNFMMNLPITRPTKQVQNAIESLVDYVQLTKTKDQNLQSAFFEILIDGLVYELYFGDELRATGVEISRFLGELLPLAPEMDDRKKNEVIRPAFDRLNASGHPVRKNLEKLDSVPVVRTIRKALNR